MESDAEAGREVLQLVFGLAMEMVAPGDGAMAVEVQGAMATRDGAEQAVEEEEADAEIAIHATLGIERMMMNVVEATGAQEPGFQDWRAFHPEILQVHAVVEVAEHEHRPGHHGCQRHGLIHAGDVEQAQRRPTKSQHQGYGGDPLHADVAKRGAAIGGIFVVFRAHGLSRTIQLKMVDEVSAAQRGEAIAMRQTVEQVADEFGEEN